jgi:mannose-6-phosphate isomerase-like protein (cupin superfamily)
MNNPRCTVVQPFQGKSYWLAGDRIRFLLGSDQTGGALAVAELEVGPDGGPPPHLHTREHELFCVIDGDIAFVKDQVSFRAGSGFAALLPRNITHTFKNVGQRQARVLVMAIPGGFDRFVVEAGAPWTGPRAPGNADIEKLLATCPKYGIEMRPTWQATQNVSPPMSDRALWVMGIHVNLKLTSTETDGQACVCEVTVAPGLGIPTHSHQREDEMFYMLDGACQFELDGQTISATPGTFLHVPKGAMHGFSNPGKAPARFLDYHTPGGFENFFLEAGVPCSDRTKPPTAPPDIARAIELMKQHGMTLAPGIG